MRFELIDRAKKDFPVQRLCRVLNVSQSGYFAWSSRFPSQRQRQDMVLLAHVRSAFALSNGTYGSPRMTRELRDQGLTVGRRRTARLMRDNGLRLGKSGVSSERRTASTPGRLPPIFWTRISPPRRQTRNGRRTFPMYGPGRGGFTWRS
jgi:transposase InsO family protein